MTKLKETEDVSTEVSSVSDFSTAKNFQMTPFLALVVSLIYMLSADGEIDDHESSQLQAVVGDHAELLEIAFEYAQNTDVSEFLLETKDILNVDDKLCILSNLCDCLLSDGVSEDHELELFGLISDSFGISQTSFHTHFNNLKIKNNKKTLGIFNQQSLTLNGQSAHLSLACCMLYMMAADGNIADEEIGQLQVVIGDFDGLQAAAMKNVRSVKMNVFLKQASPLLTQDQKIFILCNVADSMISDGKIDIVEDNLFQTMLTAFSVSMPIFKSFYETIRIKNIKPFDTKNIPTSFHARKTGKNNKSSTGTFKVRHQKKSDNSTPHVTGSQIKDGDGEWVSTVDQKELSAIVTRTMQDNIKQANDSFANQSDVDNVQNNAINRSENTVQRPVDKQKSNLLQVPSASSTENIQSIDESLKSSNKLKIDASNKVANIQQIDASLNTANVQQVETQAQAVNRQQVDIAASQTANIQQVETQAQAVNRQQADAASKTTNIQQVETQAQAVNRQQADAVSQTANIQQVEIQAQAVNRQQADAASQAANSQQLKTQDQTSNRQSTPSVGIVDILPSANKQAVIGNKAAIKQIPIINGSDSALNLSNSSLQSTSAVDMASSNLKLINSQVVVDLYKKIDDVHSQLDKLLPKQAATGQKNLFSDLVLKNRLPIDTPLSQSAKPQNIQIASDGIFNAKDFLLTAPVQTPGQQQLVPIRDAKSPLLKPIEATDDLLISQDAHTENKPDAMMQAHTVSSQEDASSSHNLATLADALAVDGGFDWRVLSLLIFIICMPLGIFARGVFYPLQTCQGLGHQERKWMPQRGGADSVVINEQSQPMSHTIKFSQTQVWVDGQRFPFYKELNQTSHFAVTSSTGIKGTFKSQGIETKRYAFDYDNKSQQLRIDIQSFGSSSIDGKMGLVQENSSFLGQCASQWF